MRRFRPPSTKQYPLGLRAGKILFGRKCNPVMMKQEGTFSFGRKKKQAPRPHSGLNYNKARAAREANKWHGRTNLQEREGFHEMLAFLVEQEFRQLSGFCCDPKKTRAMLRSMLVDEARTKLSQGYRIVRGQLELFVQ
jgi:hypothetical protein